MTLDDFVRLAQHCRLAQNRYWRGGRTAGLLAEAKLAEARLDDAIGRHIPGPDLFAALEGRCPECGCPHPCHRPAD